MRYKYGSSSRSLHPDPAVIGARGCECRSAVHGTFPHAMGICSPVRVTDDYNNSRLVYLCHGCTEAGHHENGPAWIWRIYEEKRT